MDDFFDVTLIPAEPEPFDDFFHEASTEIIKKSVQNWAESTKNQDIFYPESADLYAHLAARAEQCHDYVLEYGEKFVEIEQKYLQNSIEIWKFLMEMRDL